MKQTPLDFWNDRYGQDTFAYGTNPNAFFKTQLDCLKPGTLLLPAEGEGRNAVYATLQGWKVSAFDISEQAKRKAELLAERHKVSIEYEVTGILEYNNTNLFDVIGLCYTHFPISIRKQAHLHLINLLKPGGTMIFECFAKRQLNYNSGGPKDNAMLFSLEEVKSEFPNLEFSILKETKITLSEGEFHQGEAKVIRFVGTKL
ncbi:class I SAM-dependent methyltransferase [Formosa sediminum]|uniref:Class I SAM-dependent methyltransferase n=1 Tax=Formosa sediminum TaxID=2594004 RepID=A0A516GSV0_9FLAO|nr:class I SAM-dependent methyltransferase [Formosa sediminum]QDO94601.1 class I SAM-dependent methyltransferase [Formosa sediminum]